MLKIYDSNTHNETISNNGANFKQNPFLPMSGSLVITHYLPTVAWRFFNYN